MCTYIYIYTYYHCICYHCYLLFDIYDCWVAMIITLGPRGLGFSGEVSLWSSMGYHMSSSSIIIHISMIISIVIITLLFLLASREHFFLISHLGTLSRDLGTKLPMLLRKCCMFAYVSFRGSPNTMPNLPTYIIPTKIA